MPTMAPWTPARTAPHALYDAELSQPKNVGYVDLSGVSGDYIYCPNTTALSFNSDIELVVRVKASNWATGAIQTLMGKYTSTGNQRVWRFYVSATGTLGLTASADGTAVTSVIVTPTVALPTARFFWMRLRLDLTNGSNSVGTCDIAGDTGSNSILPLTWTANGTNTGTTISGLYTAGTAVTEIGTFNVGTTERMTGQVGRMILRSGFDGATVADFNADRCYGPGYTDGYGNPWTLSIPKLYDVSGNGRPPATFGTGLNQPKWLPWRGRSNVYLPGASTGNRLAVFATPAFDFSGGMEILLCVAMDNWKNGSQVLAGQDNSVTRSFRWQLNSNGENVITTSADGTTNLYATAVGSAVPFVNGEPYWLVFRFTPNSGGQAVVEFLWAPYSESVPTTFTSLGSSNAQAAHTLMSSTVPITFSALPGVGALSNGGRFMRAIIRNAPTGGTTLADFDAAQCTHTGMTDAYGRVWDITRHTAGVKSVVQSPAANNTRSVILLGTDDWIDVPAASIPPLDTFQPASSVTAVFRRWHNPGGSQPVFTTKSTIGDPVLGMSLRLRGIPASLDVMSVAGDGTANDNALVDNSFGSKTVFSGVYNNASPFITARNNGLSNTDTARATTVSTSTGGGGRIGAYMNGAIPTDMEFEALVTYMRDASADHPTLVNYYRGGL